MKLERSKPTSLKSAPRVGHMPTSSPSASFVGCALSSQLSLGAVAPPQDFEDKTNVQ
jgi:hypothetical protein